MPGIPPDKPAEEITRAVFKRVVNAWVEGDVESALALMSDDVVHVVNVDSEPVPFARTVRGKPAMRENLDLTLDAFDLGAYVTDHVSLAGNIARARIKIIYIHKQTRERLITSFRLVVEQREGLIARIDKFHDASYLEAFSRFVDRPDDE